MPVHPPAKKSRRGFASMTPEKLSRISSVGGRKAHALGHGHTFTHAEAVAANLRRGPGKLQRLILDELARQERFALAELCQTHLGKPWSMSLYQAARTLADRGMIGKTREGKWVFIFALGGKRPAGR